MGIRKWLGFSALILAGVVALAGSWRSGNLRSESQESKAVRPAGHSSDSGAASETRDDSAKARVAHNLLQVPMSFEANEGQTDSRVKFLSRGSAYTVFLTSTEAVLALRTAIPAVRVRDQNTGFGSNPGNPLSVGSLDRTPPAAPAVAKAAAAPSEDVLRMQLVGANASARVSGVDETSAKSNYFIGKDPKKWHTNVSNFAKVAYAGIYPGVNLVYYGNQRQLEYDFVVSPGADPSVITLGFAQINSAQKSPALHIDANGNLVAHLAAGDISFHKPRVYQTVANNSQETHSIDSRYVLKAEGQAGFELGDYDHNRQLVIDPVISFATYIGGSNEDMAMGIAFDKFNDVVIAGNTRSADFPLFTPLENYHPGTCGTLACRDVFVSKFNPVGTKLQYSSYIGGSNDDVASDAVVDLAGDIFVVGYTLSTDFPVTFHAFQKNFGGGTVTGDAFAFELASKGIGLEYATYIGGSSDDQAYSITLDSVPSATPSAYVVGYTTSSNFPISTGAYQTVCGLTKAGTCANGFATKINYNGSIMQYSTFLGGSGGLGDAAYGAAVDANNDLYISGITGSPNFPTTPGAYDRTCGTDALCNGTFDGFVTELNTTATGILFSTFLGGSNYDYAAGITVDTTGAIYVSGNTISNDFPTTAAAAQSTFGGMSAGCNPVTGAICGDVTVTKFNPGGSTLAYSTYLGGSLDEYPGLSMAIDASGNAYITGQTSSSANFPLVSAFQPAFGGGPTDAFLTVVNPTGTAFTSSSFLGGNNRDFGFRTAVDSSGSVYVSGGTLSTNFPVKPGAFQMTCGTDGNCNGGLMDAWVAKLVPSADVSLTLTTYSTVKSGAKLTYLIVVRNNGPDAAAAVSTTDAVPAGTTFASVTTTAGSCTAPPVGGTGNVTCTLNPMPSGSKMSITMIVNVTAAAGSVITDKATVSSTTFDPKKGNNQAQKSTTVD